MSTRYAPRKHAPVAGAWVFVPPGAPPLRSAARACEVLPLPESVAAASPAARAPAIAAALRLRLASNRARPPRAIIVVAGGAIEGPHCMPGPAVAGVPVSLMPRECCAALLSGADRAAPADRVRCAVLAMWQREYLEWGKRLADSARRGVGSDAAARIAAWPATEVLRADLCRHLASGPALAIYVGHGRARGWSGYRGVRWRHVEACPAVRPITALLAFTCSNLCAPADGEPSFGELWVTSGRAHAFFGATGAVQMDSLVLMGRELERILESGAQRDVASIIARLDRGLRRARDPDAIAAWRMFRLVGNPLAPLAAPAITE